MTADLTERGAGLAGCGAGCLRDVGTPHPAPKRPFLSVIPVSCGECGMFGPLSLYIRVTHRESDLLARTYKKTLRNTPHIPQPPLLGVKASTFAWKTTRKPSRGRLSLPGSLRDVVRDVVGTSRKLTAARCGRRLAPQRKEVTR